MSMDYCQECSTKFDTDFVEHECDIDISDHKDKLIQDLAHFVLNEDIEDMEKLYKYTENEEYEKYVHVKILNDLADFVHEEIRGALELVRHEINSGEDALKTIDNLLKEDYI